MAKEFTYRKCVNEKKKRVIAFCKKHGRLPRRGEIDIKESSYHHYHNPASKSFDPVYRRTLLKLCAIKPYSPAQGKRDILHFIVLKKRIPSAHSKSSLEHRLGVLRRNYTDRKAYPTLYDRQFAALIKKLRDKLELR